MENSGLPYFIYVCQARSHDCIVKSHIMVQLCTTTPCYYIYFPYTTLYMFYIHINQCFAFSSYSAKITFRIHIPINLR